MTEDLDLRKGFHGELDLIRQGITHLAASVIEASSAPTASSRCESSSWPSASMARVSCFSTMPPIDSTPERMPSISTSNCLLV